MSDNNSVIVNPQKCSVITKLVMLTLCVDDEPINSKWP